MSKILPSFENAKYPDQARALWSLRAAKGKTQRDIADMLSKELEPEAKNQRDKLRTYQKWERGEERPDCLALLVLAKKYKVSCDHLLGLIPESNHDIKFIHDETGLSEPAIKKLKAHKDDIMLHNDSDSVESFPDVVSSIIEHDHFDSFINRLMQSKSLRSTITKLHKRSKEKVQECHLYLMQMGYTIMPPGKNNTMSIYDAKQEISRIIDDLFRDNESGYTELRN